MPASNLKMNVIRAGRAVLTTRPIMGIIDRLGLKSTLSRSYWWLLYRASGGEYTQQVGDVSTTFHASSVSSFRHYHTLVGERPVIADLLSRLDTDDVFYDVGAYIGSYTCLAATHLTDGQVVSFEPRANHAVEIEANLSRNDLQADVRRVALSDEAGETAISASARLSESGPQRVSLERGDRLVERGSVPAPTVVKIDVEGVEAKVIRGMEATLSRPDCRLVYCEVHPTFLDEFDSTEEEVLTGLEACGFTVETIHTRGQEYIIRAEKESQ
ncbi:FkbM family methyltransferase [Haladaptatus sp. CMAA 1911]|uniref:FkbM family methyltransferase n=1 Tax=unclassified Haladaptatus TaxID=2622732 RepID=UPI0037549EA8